MMELDIDQSHLPRVQEAHTESPAVPVSVKHNTAPESGAKEFEQYYNSNVQKSQLVQNDIRMAKRLQDEEAEHASQAARQLEERDSEYARMIQEEIQRCAEDARRREEQDEEMAKRLQEEEELDIRRRRLDSGCHGDGGDVVLLGEERASVPERSRPRRPVRARRGPSTSPSPDSSFSEGETRVPPASRGRSSRSNTDSDSAEPPREPRSPVLQNNSVPQQASRQSDALRLIRNLLRESLGPTYNFDEEVFLRPPSVPAYRLQKRLNTAPSGQQGLDRHSQGRRNHSFPSSDRAGEGWEEGAGGSRRNGNRDERWHSNSYHGDMRREDEYHSNDARYQDRVSYSQTYREGGEYSQRHVHFQDDRRRYNSYHGDGRRETATGGYQNNFLDRGVAARRSSYGESRPVQRSGSQGNQDVHRTGTGGFHHLSQVLLRTVPARRSYHGDVRDRRREAGRDDRRAYGDQGAQIGHRVSARENPPIQEDRVYRPGDHRDNRSAGQDHGDRRERGAGSHGNGWGREEGGAGRDNRSADQDHGERRERGGGSRGNGWGREQGGASGDRGHGDRRVRRSVSERWGAREEEPGSSSEEEEEEEGRWRVERRRSEGGGQREERPPSRGVRRSISFSGRTPPPAAGHRGAGPAPRRDGASLELRELGQVLRDEELARMLQEEEEERLLRKSPTSPRSPQDFNPRGDFRVAQVAQDEEIARFMQRNERKTQRRSGDPEGQGSQREHDDPGNGQERRSARERKVEVPQGPRLRLDSEGLNSPSEDLSPECQPPSPSSAASQLQAVRNIAEELDPTFRAIRRDSNPAGQASSALSTSPSSPSGLHDYTPEPTFVPPTKRQSDKSTRSKAKEKKESCKQQ
ncbi:eukaryotic translation initiation factor 3 subunit A-like isoform X2 [Anguilla anguilla]|uniref:eukaryotic translation initiation factor 3 subunit A-like isoform X2 n=1 Tax=Anguilla anguilla TaxID=7936 RepID=UPI0015B0F2A3|nr:eukaryotic translation initiation factor 3 subunit A-like isoform X2 [Anguilla anguilla]